MMGVLPLSHLEENLDSHFSVAAGGSKALGCYCDNGWILYKRKICFVGDRAEYYDLKESSKAHCDGLNKKCVPQTHALNACFSAIRNVLEVFGAFRIGIGERISRKRLL